MRPRMGLAFHWCTMVSQWKGHHAPSDAPWSAMVPVFAMEHNYQYVFGRKVILWTDPKALVFIMQKPLTSALKRLECLIATSAVWLRDTLKAWERHASSRLSIKSCHEGLWAFPRWSGRTHSCQPLPSRSRPPTQWNPWPEIDRDDLWASSTEVEKNNLGWLPDLKDYLQAAFLPSNCKQASSTSVSRPEQLGKTTVTVPSKAQDLSVTPNKPQVGMLEPLDLNGCQSHQVTCRTMYKYNWIADCRPMSSPIHRFRVQNHRVHITDLKACKFCSIKPDQETNMPVLS